MNITYSLYHIAQTNGLSPSSVYYAARKLFGRENGEFTKEEAQQILQFINDDTKNKETTSQTGTCSTGSESCGRVVEQVPGNIVDPSHLNSGLQVFSIIDEIEQYLYSRFPQAGYDKRLHKKLMRTITDAIDLGTQVELTKLRNRQRTGETYIPYETLNRIKEPEDYGF